MQTKGYFTNILEKFLRVSTVHGVNRIFQKSSTKVERILWSLGVISATAILSYVTWNIGYIYRYTPLKTVISELKRPIYKIPFPEVIICNRNRLNWQRFEQAKSKFLRPRHRTPQHERVFLEVVNAYDTLRFGKFINFKNLSNLYPPKLLKDLNYVNMTQVTQFMAWKCHEIFSECSWLNQSYDCCKIFSPRRSQQGLCLAFNSIETLVGKQMLESDPYYPWRTKDIGPENGLVLRIHVNEGQQSPLRWGFRGAVVMLVEPHVWSYLPHEVPANTRAMIMISGFEQFFDETTRVFPTETRQCVFEDELDSLYYKSLQDHKYMFENCQSECEQEYLVLFCNCTIDLFYPPGPYRACGIVDLPCIYKHNDVLQNIEQVFEHEYVAHHEGGMNCPCFFNCKSLQYSIDVHIDYGLAAMAPLYPNNTEIELSVFFLWETIRVYKTTAVYTILDLMASLGGLAGLCIGCSLVGITELLYFALIDLPKQSITNLKRKHGNRNPSKRTLKTKIIFVQQKV